MADLSMGAVVLLLGLMPITSARAAPACLGCSARPHGQPFVSSGPPLYVFLLLYAECRVQVCEFEMKPFLAFLA